MSPRPLLWWVNGPQRRRTPGTGTFPVCRAEGAAERARVSALSQPSVAEVRRSAGGGACAPGAAVSGVRGVRGVSGVRARRPCGAGGAPEPPGSPADTSSAPRGAPPAAEPGHALEAGPRARGA